jgi:ribonuclease BN (tRNA processing enzyme)
VADRAIVADLGSGAFAKLLQYRTAESIDAIVVSHMHADHFLDVIPMRYALKYGKRTNDRKVPLYLPPAGDVMLARLVGAFVPESPHDFMGEVFEVHAYDPSATLRIGDVRVRFAPTTHYIPTFALRCEGADASVTFSADTAPDERVTTLAAKTGALICETTLARAEEAECPRGHLSAREAASMAARAEVAQLVLTHYPQSADVAQLAADARAVYSGKVTVADDGLRFSVGRS